jgi:tetratricopeptide (TPR) repeat protein
VSRPFDVLLAAGVVQRTQGDYRAAIATFRQAESLVDASIGAVESARLLNELGVAHRYHGDAAQARHSYRRAMDLVHPVIGWTVDAKDLFATLCHNLASLEQTRGDLRPAVFWARLAIHIRSGVHGTENLSVLGDEAVLATILQDLGEVPRADKLFRKILRQYQQRLGERHYEVAVVLHNLAACTSALGDDRTALSMALESLSMKQAALGEEHPDIAVTLANVGRLQEKLGDMEAAAATYREAVSILRDHVQPDHPTLIACLIRSPI